MPLVQIVQGMLDSNAVTASNITDGAVTGSKIAANISLTTLSAVSLSASQLTVSAGTSAIPAISPAGDTNTGIFFPAADTIAFATSGQLCMRHYNTGQVVVGNRISSPTALFNISKFQVLSGRTVLQANFEPYALGVQHNGGVNPFYVGASNNLLPDLIFSQAGGSEIARITNDGYLRMSNSSLGIQFNGDTAEANALDDYEEGEWTGTLTGLTTNPTTPVTATGNYIKIGRLVFANIAFAAFSNVGASGSIRITGLPFSASPSVATGNVMLYDCATYGAGTANVSPYVTSTVVDIYYMTSNGGYFQATHNAGTNRFIQLSVTYRV